MLSMGLPSFFLKSQIFFRNFIATEYLYVSISVRYRLEVHTYFSFCFRDSLRKLWFLLSVSKSSSEITALTNSISPILNEISYAYELFRRFLHSENTRSDAFTLVILYCIFQWDVAAITVDRPLLVLCEIFQFWYCQPGEEPYCNFPFQKSGFCYNVLFL